MKWLVAVLLSMACGAQAAIDTYEFDSTQQREQFQQLSEELRCPKCQNQNLADSNSPIASDLRAELYRMVIDGQSENQIKDFMVARYGDFVLYKPPVNTMTYVLWYGPFVLLFFGAVLVVAISWRRKSSQRETVETQIKHSKSESELSDNEHKAKIAALLDTKND